MRVDPKLLVLLLVVVAIAAVVRLGNPHRKYSTREFWETATVATVAEVPQKALAPGNKNGGVLMWASMGARDPEILRALVARGADVNESDVVFAGTPMSAAAGKSEHPEMIGMLAELGADPNKRVSNGDTPAMVASKYNRTPGIIEALAEAGADMSIRNHDGYDVLFLARAHQNDIVEQALMKLIPPER
ncbi:MAG TPA: ankyrin repeat domain-containing protein [Steroidobacteraceae bacterium]|jgi:ankyrin repeat protein|nr:ankyrin repeat domain-containing protein [Steroidobacteraceae bacterium]